MRAWDNICLVQVAAKRVVAGVRRLARGTPKAGRHASWSNAELTVELPVYYPGKYLHVFRTTDSEIFDRDMSVGPLFQLDSALELCNWGYL